MSTFTITLKKALDIQPDIGLNDYLIYDETHRTVLNEKIIDHFWNREIGQETIEMFRLALRRKMNEIMPLYNQQYLASQIAFNPLLTTKMSNTTDTTGTSAGTEHSTSGSTSNAKSRAVASETPQTMLAATGDYATSAQDNISDTDATGTSDGTRSGTDTGHAVNDMEGYNGAPAALIYEYRQTMVNIDMMIINELENLFMLVWSNGDEFTERGMSVDYYYGLPF